MSTAEEIAETQRRSDWRRLSAGAGTRGPRLHDSCYLELADLEGEESNHHSQVLWTRGLLIRRYIATAVLPTSQPGVRQGLRSRPWSASRAVAGRSRIASRQPKRVRLRPRQIGILARLASSRLTRHSRLRHDGCHPTSGQQADAQKKQVQSATPRHPTHPLVDPGNPPHRSTSRTKTDSTPTSSHRHSGGALIRPQHRKLISNENHNCNARSCRRHAAARPAARARAYRQIVRRRSKRAAEDAQTRPS